jgi:hypothetical protein
VNCGHATKWQRKFHHKFSGITIPSTTSIHELINEVKSTGSLLYKNPLKKCSVATKEKLDEIRATLKDTPQKSLRCFAQENSI